jgi:very-short-patch-repair endonuclease
MRLNNRHSLKDRRRELRNNSTNAEHLLWYQLRGSKVDGRKFRRQHSIGPFIADFYCPEERLAIELDGDIHDEPDRIEYDARRTQYLEDHGIQVLRFRNGQVLADQSVIIAEIRKIWKGKEREAPPPKL